MDAAAGSRNGQPPLHILPIIVLAQFAGTSLWFAGNAVVPDLIETLKLGEKAVGYITSAVQFGFISGTLVFAFLSVADRLSPGKVFLGCTVLGAGANAIMVFGETVWMLLFSRFATGFFLAGIYPVGMKIASDWYRKGLGRAMGYLVGALVLGTAFPHLMKHLLIDVPWWVIIAATSCFAASGGILLHLMVPDGPAAGPKGSFKPGMLRALLGRPRFRSAACGYFGHMWELYAFWAFVPSIIAFYSQAQAITGVNVSLWTFFVIAIGGTGCALGGHLALRIGSERVAMFSLIGSGLCCALSPIALFLPFEGFVMFLLLWGFLAVSDSPQFSTLIADAADKRYVATGLTMVTSIGFGVTIFSIEAINSAWANWQTPYVFVLLGIGPLLGIVALARGTDSSR